MEKIWAFLEKLLAPILLMAVGGLVVMYMNFHVMEYQLNELIAWKSSGERCTKEDCSTMLIRIISLEKDVAELESELKEIRNDARR